MRAYVPESELSSERTILASASEGDGKSYQPWRYDETGELWYRLVDASDDDGEIIQGVEPEAGMRQVIIGGEVRSVPAMRIPGGTVSFDVD